MAKKKRNLKPRVQPKKSRTNIPRQAQVHQSTDQDMLQQQIYELQTNMGMMQAQRPEHLQLRDAFLFFLSRLDGHLPNIQKELAEYFSTNHNLSGRVDINTYNIEGYEDAKESKRREAVTKCRASRTKKFSDFKLKHQGETCYIFGAGPGLAKFVEVEKAPHFSIGINAAVERSGCAYGITTDKDAFIKYGKEGVLWFLPEYMNESPGIPSREATPNGENIVLWKMNTWRDSTKLEQSVEELAFSRELFCYSSSAHPAVHLAYYMGARNLVLVGIDGSLSIDWYAIHKGVTHTLCEMLFPNAHEIYAPPNSHKGRLAPI